MTRFRSGPFNVTIITVYAPTPQTQPNVKNAFYNEPRGLVNRIPRRDILLNARDWGAGTAPSDEFTHHIPGRFGFGERCENGDRLVSFAELN